MKKHLALAATITSLTSTSLFTSAENFYAGATVGESDVEILDIDAGKETAFSFKAGYDFSEHFSLEAFYNDFGENEDSSTNIFGAPVSLKSTAEHTSFGLAAIGVIPLTNSFSLYGKAGVENWESEFTFSFQGTRSGQTISSSSDKLDGTDIFWGVGARYDISELLELNLNYELHSWEENDVDIDINALSIGLNVKF